MSRAANVLRCLRGTWPETAAVVLPALAIVFSTHTGTYTDGFVDVNLNPGQWLRSLLHAWTPNSFLTGVDTGFWQSTLSITAFYTLLMNGVGLSLAAAERIWLFTIVAMGGASMLFLLRVLLPRLPTARVVGPALYVINLPTLASLKEGSTYSTAATLVLPAEMALLILALRSGRLRPYGVALAALNAIVACSNVPVAAIIFCALFLTWLAWTIAHPGGFRSALRIGIGSVALIGAFNVYWIVPFLTFMRGYYIPAFNAENVDVQSRVSSFLNEFRGLGLFGFDTAREYAHDAYFAFAQPYLHAPVVILALFIAPAFAITALLVARGRYVRVLLAVSAVGLLGVLLAGGAYPGAPGAWPNWSSTLYRSLYYNVPFFQAFRASYKWQVLVQLWISIAAAYAFAVLWERGRWHKAAALLLPAGVVVVAIPVMAIGLFSPEQHFTVPGYWRDAGGYMRASAPRDARVVAMPDQFFENYFWGQTRGSVVLPLFERAPFMDFPGPSRSRYVSNVAHAAFDERVLRDPEALREMWRLIGATHVLSRMDFDWTDFGFRSSPIAQETALGFLARPTKTFGSLRLWNLPGAAGTAFVSDDVDIVADEGLFRDLLFGGAPVATSIVADGIDEATLARLVQARIGHVVLPVDGVDSMALSIATRAAALCTDAPGRVRIAAGAYAVVLQDRSLVTQSLPTATHVVIDGTSSVPVAQSGRAGAFVVLEQRYLNAGAHSCQVIGAEDAQDVRAFLVPTTALAASARAISGLSNGATRVASLRADGTVSSFSLDRPGHESLFGVARLQPRSDGVLATVRAGTGVTERSAHLPVLLASGFTPTRPERVGSGFADKPLLRETRRTVFLMGSSAEAMVYAPRALEGELRFRAAALTEPLTLSVSPPAADGIRIALRPARNTIKLPLSAGAIDAGTVVSVHVHLYRGWNRIRFEDDASPAAFDGQLMPPAAVAIAEADLAIRGPVDVVPNGCSVVAGQNNPAVAPLALHVDGGTPCLISTRISPAPVADSLELRYVATGSRSAKSGVFLGISATLGSPPERWVQVPVDLVSSGSEGARGISGELLHAREGDVRGWITAAMPYLADEAGGPSDMLLDLTLSTYRAAIADSATSDRAAWRFDVDGGSTLHVLRRSVAQATSRASVLTLRATHPVEFEAAPSATTVRVAYRATTDSQPEITVEHQGENYYPGLTHEIQHFSPSGTFFTGFHQVADVPSDVPIQLDDDGHPKGTWLLRDGQALTYAAVISGPGQWTLEAGGAGYRVAVDSSEATTSHQYMLVVQPSSWFHGDGTRSVAVLPGTAFEAVRRDLRSATLRLRFVARDATQLIADISPPVLSREIDPITVAIPNARIFIDGRQAGSVGDRLGDGGTLSIGAGQHTLTCSCNGREGFVTVAGHLDDVARHPIPVDGTWPYLRIKVAPSNRPRVLVFQQTYDSQWNASAAGAVLPHFRADYAFNGFLIPPHAESVEVGYDEPERLLWMARAFSLFMLVAAIAGMPRRAPKS